MRVDEPPELQVEEWPDGFFPEQQEKTERTEPFFPNFLFKEALVALVAFVVLILVVVYVEVPLESVADPTDSNYVPRPEWYFLFLFELLKYFPGKWEPLAAVFLPGLFIALLVFLPFIDRKRETKALKRPLASLSAMAVLGVLAILTVSAIQSTPPQVSVAIEDGRRLTPTEASGLSLYKAQRCNSCHAINGEGETSGPDLGKVGSVRTAEWLHTFLEDPQATYPNTTMPSYLGKLTHQEVEDLARYLATLK